MNDTPQPSYWQLRWRDEKVENERLLQEIADLQTLLKLANIDMRITTQLSRSIKRNSRLANVLSDALALLEQVPLSATQSAQKGILLAKVQEALEQ